MGKLLTGRSLKERLILKRQNVRRKLYQLKHGEMLQEALYNPITKHLRSIESKLQNNTNTVPGTSPPPPPPTSPRSYTVAEADIRPETKLFASNEGGQHGKLLKLCLKHEDNDSTGSGNDNVANRNRFDDIAEKSFTEYLEQYEDPLPRKYISEMYADKNNREFDHKYGVRLDDTIEQFMIGDSKLDFNGADIYVKGKRYKGSQGLYELLFRKYPNMNFCSSDDVNTYRQIVYKTNAHRKYYRSNTQLDGSKLQKYKKIIAPPLKMGQGLMNNKNITTTMEYSSNDKDYIYWDDPNELVSRLRLLIASQAAGHSGHGNEINSLVEELRESKYIE
ncbi:unnamed protein product [Acanthoscelides obtectus]|uniref:DUF8207 domain-containing protein n=1 Tax=Acanthoscelides obtectus TaxID=200917 RepID=A0A9P0Q4J0_ACAOB|nr:unnamed protein product [Acanthoscelides obtectus]CAK1680417.1 hypothetical protein AOBTE_LOCUS32638 [Acanthoscelides obtectus]